MTIDINHVWVARLTKSSPSCRYYAMGIRVDKSIARSANLSRSGLAITILTEDELKALVGIGLKPFAHARLEVEFRDEHVFCHGIGAAIRFDLIDAKFSGGFGSWETLLEPSTVREERIKKQRARFRKEIKPKGF